MMDKYIADAIEAMLCRELDDIVRHGIKSHQDLDDVKDSVETIKNLAKIESMGGYIEGGIDMREYSQRGSNYRMGNYAQGNSYNNYYGRDSYARGDMGGNPNRMYEPYMMKGYSGTGSKEEILEGLHQMVKDTSDEKIKTAVLDCISKMEK